MHIWEADQIKDFNFTDAENQAKDRFQQLGKELKSVQFVSEFTSAEGKESSYFGGFEIAFNSIDEHEIFRLIDRNHPIYKGLNVELYAGFYSKETKSQRVTPQDGIFF